MLDETTRKIVKAIYKITARILGDHIVREYTPAQLATIALTNIMLGRTWREAKKTAKEIAEIIGLKKTPAYTTVYTFFQKMPIEKIIAILATSVAMAVKKPMALVVDSTGISLEESSIKYILKHKPKKRRWLKLHVIADCRSKVIVLIDVSTSEKHDVTVLKERLLKELEELKEKYGFEVEFFAGDGAYDDKDVHGFVEYKLGAKSLIRVRVIKGSIRSALRKRVFQRLKRPEFRAIYCKLRSFIEALFRSFFRVFGYAIRCRKLVSCFKWLLACAFLWNARVLCGLVGRGFWSS